MTGKPTDVLGRRFAAYFLDGILSAIVLGLLVIPAFLSAADQTSFPTSSQASRYCNTTPASNFDEQTESTDPQPRYTGSGLCLALEDTAYVVPESKVGTIALLGGLGLFIVGILNLVVLQGMTGATAGKHALGIRTVNRLGQPAGIGRMLLRLLGGLVDGICYGVVGLIVVLASSERRRVADLAAGTWVVDRSSVGRSPELNPYAQQGGYAQQPPYPQLGAFPPQAGWAPPTTVAATPTPGADAPTWDSARNAYIQYDRTLSQWVQWDNATNAWRALDQ